MAEFLQQVAHAELALPSVQVLGVIPGSHEVRNIRDLRVFSLAGKEVGLNPNMKGCRMVPTKTAGRSGQWERLSGSPWSSRSR
jgi:hypothetical protein